MRNKKIWRLFRRVLLMLLVAMHCRAAVNPTTRKILAFDDNWLFTLASAPHAEAPEFPDSGWRKLSLPHDWVIEGQFDQASPVGGNGAFLSAGTGWYRKHFALSKTDKGKRVFVDFEGVRLD